MLLDTWAHICRPALSVRGEDQGRLYIGTDKPHTSVVESSLALEVLVLLLMIGLT